MFPRFRASVVFTVIRVTRDDFLRSYITRLPRQSIYDSMYLSHTYRTSIKPLNPTMLLLYYNIYGETCQIRFQSHLSHFPPYLFTYVCLCVLDLVLHDSLNLSFISVPIVKLYLICFAEFDFQLSEREGFCF